MASLSQVTAVRVAWRGYPQMKRTWIVERYDADKDVTKVVFDGSELAAMDKMIELDRAETDENVSYSSRRTV
jgi:hypothetical protein